MLLLPSENELWEGKQDVRKLLLYSRQGTVAIEVVPVCFGEKDNMREHSLQLTHSSNNTRAEMQQGIQPRTPT